MTCVQWKFILVGQEGTGGHKVWQSQTLMGIRKNKAFPNCGGSLLCYTSHTK